MKEIPKGVKPVGAKKGQITVDLNKPETLIAETERKLFGFKCAVRDGTLAERECERRIWTFFSVISDQHLTLMKSNEAVTDGEIAALISSLIEHLRPIYRTAEKELSTKNILDDILQLLASKGYLLTHAAQ